MSDSSSNPTPDLPNWITDHIALYQTDPAAGHLWTPPTGGDPVPTLLLTTQGRRSGEPRTMPLIYGDVDDGKGSVVIIASKGGAPSHPAWYLNLVADSSVTVQVGTRQFTGTARVAAGDERSKLWSAMTEVWPPYTDYQAATERQIPVVVLEPSS